MIEVVFNAPNMAVLISASTALGFYAPASADGSIPARIISTGEPVGGGSWFYNFVGPIYLPNGQTAIDPLGNLQPVLSTDGTLWGRLRMNGDSAPLSQIISACRSYGITIYELIFPQIGYPYWSPDGGATHAPDFVASVGLIA